MLRGDRGLGPAREPGGVKSTVVVALGGNALTRASETGTFEEQRTNAAEMAKAVAGLVKRGHSVVITHGNGPQVGSLAIQQEQAAAHIPPQPLFVLDAMTQGQIGHVLGAELTNALGKTRTVVGVVTHVEVDPRDPAWSEPSKPIGPFFDESEARRLARDRGWEVAEDSDRGWRRVVASPEPQVILEARAIKALVDQGFVVIAAGGGGVPVVRRRRRYEGVDAVVDKDYSAAKLATEVGASVLMLLTGVDRLALDYGTPKQRDLPQLSVEEAEHHLSEGQFPRGSMGPKVRAAIRFLEAGGDSVIITSPRRAAAALEGTQGTHLLPERAHAVGQ
jgi:carbamate kinase